MISSIQLSNNTKQALDSIKKNSKESYEEVIVSLIQEREQKKREFEELMIEGYKEMEEESAKIMEEFKYADAEIEWEWDGHL